MKDITERIQELIDETGKTNKDFAEEIGVSPAIISHITSGRNKPSLNLIQQITNVYTNVNLDYLLNGKGNLWQATSAAGNTLGSAKSEVDDFPGHSPFNEGVRAVGVPEGAPLPKREEDAVEQTIPEVDDDLQMFDKRKSASKEKKAKEPIKVMLFYEDHSVEIYYPQQKTDS